MYVCTTRLVVLYHGTAVACRDQSRLFRPHSLMKGVPRPSVSSSMWVQLYALSSVSPRARSLVRVCREKEGRRNFYRIMSSSRWALVLDPALKQRDDRPERIALPQSNSSVRMAVRRVLSGSHREPRMSANGVAQPTLWLNDSTLSANASLLSRCHAEIGWEQRCGRSHLIIYDGDPDNDKPSLNGTSVDDTLVPRGGAMVVQNGARINFGAPHVLSATRTKMKKRKVSAPDEFIYIVTAPPDARAPGTGEGSASATDEGATMASPAKRRAKLNRLAARFDDAEGHGKNSASRSCAPASADTIAVADADDVNADAGSRLAAVEALLAAANDSHASASASSCLFGAAALQGKPLPRSFRNFVDDAVGSSSVGADAILGTVGQASLFLALSRLGHAVPQPLVAHCIEALLAPACRSDGDQPASDEVLSAMARVRAGAAAAHATRHHRRAPPDAAAAVTPLPADRLDGGGQLLSAVLDAARTLLPLSATDADGVSDVGAYSSAILRATALCQLLAASPSLPVTVAHARQAVAVFASRAEAARHGRRSSATAPPPAAFDEAAQGLAIAVLARQSAAAAEMVAAQLAASGCDERTLRTVDALLCAAAARSAVDAGAATLLHDVLRSSLPTTRFAAAAAAPSAAPLTAGGPHDAALALLWRRPLFAASGGDARARATTGTERLVWSELILIASHALRYLLSAVTADEATADGATLRDGARVAIADLRACHRAATASSSDRDVDVRAAWLFGVAECLIGP